MDGKGGERVRERGRGEIGEGRREGEYGGRERGNEIVKEGEKGKKG